MHIVRISFLALLLIAFAAGCGDTVASFLSCGALSRGICVNVAGTSSPLSFTTGAFRADSSQVLACCQSPVPGLWYSYAYINGGGMNLEWFLKEIANIPGIEGRNLITFDDLSRLAEAVTPRKEDPMFCPQCHSSATPTAGRQIARIAKSDRQEGIAKRFAAVRNRNLLPSTLGSSGNCSRLMVITSMQNPES